MPMDSMNNPRIQNKLNTGTIQMDICCSGIQIELESMDVRTTGPLLGFARSKFDQGKL